MWQTTVVPRVQVVFLFPVARTFVVNAAATRSPIPLPVSTRATRMTGLPLRPVLRVRLVASHPVVNVAPVLFRRPPSLRMRQILACQGGSFPSALRPLVRRMCAGAVVLRTRRNAVVVLAGRQRG